MGRSFEDWTAELDRLLAEQGSPTRARDYWNKVLVEAWDRGQSPQDFAAAGLAANPPQGKAARSVQSSELTPGPKESRASRRTLYWTLGGVAAILFLFFGNVHVVQSEKGTGFVPKVHFTLSETFVSLDAITGMPFQQAKARWPLAVKALQRDGFLETDEAFQRRIEEQVQAEMSQAQREAEEAMRRAMGGN